VRSIGATIFKSTSGRPTLTLTIYQVDAFTAKPFAGNPAAVCLLPAARDEAWMQAIAREMSLSETAFLVPNGDDFDLRWFTPAVEVDLCGHATLASAHILWETDVLPPETEARFQTRSGLLTAARCGDWIELDFPSTPATPADPPDALLRALAVDPRYVGKSRFDYLVEVDSEATVRGLAPDFALLATVPVRGVMVTSSASTPGFDFVSRFFAPAVGINEDPVTGSAHCCLGPFWADRLGRNDLIAFQVSSRGGTVRVGTAGDRVILGGQAITVMRAELLA
jgi:predicted PhzF superfamily epimerase YddE/YHI9